MSGYDSSGAIGWHNFSQGFAIITLSFLYVWSSSHYFSASTLTLVAPESDWVRRAKGGYSNTWHTHTPSTTTLLNRGCVKKNLPFFATPTPITSHEWSSFLQHTGRGDRREGASSCAEGESVSVSLSATGELEERGAARPVESETARCWDGRASPF